jgi:hypothetical protein
MQICENTPIGPFWPLILKWVGQQTPNSILTFLLCPGRLCQNCIMIRHLELKLDNGNEVCTDDDAEDDHNYHTIIRPPKCFCGRIKIMLHNRIPSTIFID